MDNEKVVRARANLILTKPFFASIALRLTLVEDRGCETMYTDSVVLGYNPDFVDSLLPAELRAVIAHEALHVVFLHMFRRGNREHKKWNRACDHAINLILYDDGFNLPKDALMDRKKYHNKTADVIYNLLPDEPSSDQGGMGMGEVRDYNPNTTYPSGGQGGNGKSGTIHAVGASTVEEQERNWEIEITRAVAIAKSQGKMPGELDRLIDEILEPVLPWREILSRFTAENSKNDYTWTKPNSRYLYSGIYLPSLSTPSLGTIIVIVDTSMSVKTHELTIFASELHSILTLYPDTEIKVIYVDTRVAGCETMSLDNFVFNVRGGGGTDFRPGFELIEKDGMMPSFVIYFTDGECNRFPEAPDYPTLWVLTGRADFDPPFGEKVYVED